MKNYTNGNGSMAKEKFIYLNSLNNKIPEQENVEKEITEDENISVFQKLTDSAKNIFTKTPEVVEATKKTTEELNSVGLNSEKEQNTVTDYKILQVGRKNIANSTLYNKNAKTRAELIKNSENLFYSNAGLSGAIDIALQAKYGESIDFSSDNPLEWVKSIQRIIGLNIDGLTGGETITAIENLLDDNPIVLKEKIETKKKSNDTAASTSKSAVEMYDQQSAELGTQIKEIKNIIAEKQLNAEILQVGRKNIANSTLYNKNAKTREELIKNSENLFYSDEGLSGSIDIALQAKYGESIDFSSDNPLEWVKSIQRIIGLNDDGLTGRNTITAIENLLNEEYLVLNKEINTGSKSLTTLEEALKAPLITPLINKENSITEMIAKN